ncbi:MAG: phospholipase [Elusimicrobia bacterium]|nr:phospholipase [Elusimicrobiota bacterium]
MPAEFFEPGRNCWSLRSSSFSGAVVDGLAYYEAFARAALAAERQLFIAGWQFDTTVELIRGEAAETFGAPTSLLAFLNHLCEIKPQLEIYILAWDFSFVFGLDREWKQEWLFNWHGGPRIHFQFDRRHPVGACNHEKLVVVDGWWAFLGGMDLCNGRWDIPGHPFRDPRRRNADGTVYPPKHDVQAVLEGPPAEELAWWFVRQWRTATNEPIADPVVIPKEKRPFRPTVEIPAGPVALSQTRGRLILPPRRPVTQIQRLVVDAIASTRRTLYIENQYLTSKAVHDALRDLLNRSDAPLEIAVMMPLDRAGLEFYTIAGAEQKLIEELMRLARRRGHRLGVFHPIAADSDGARSVWVHSKLLIVDDSFLMIGSSNFANRSMGFDTEINASWFAEAGSPTALAIADLRARLLAEHLGFEIETAPEPLRRLTGIVEAVETFGVRRGKVRRYSPPALSRLVASFNSQKTIIDPEATPIEDSIDSLMRDSSSSPVARSLASLIEWMSLRRRRARRHRATVSPKNAR